MWPIVGYHERKTGGVVQKRGDINPRGGCRKPSGSQLKVIAFIACLLAESVDFDHESFIAHLSRIA